MAAGVVCGVAGVFGFAVRVDFTGFFAAAGFSSVATALCAAGMAVCSAVLGAATVFVVRLAAARGFCGDFFSPPAGSTGLEAAVFSAVVVLSEAGLREDVFFAVALDFLVGTADLSGATPDEEVESFSCVIEKFLWYANRRRGMAPRNLAA